MDPREAAEVAEGTKNNIHTTRQFCNTLPYVVWVACVDIGS